MMENRTHPLRRRALLGAIVVGLAGCGEGGTTTTAAGPADGKATTTSTDTDSSAGVGGTSTTEPALDLAEANVTGVETASSGDGVRFDVTVYHDDDGETGYANWWQVESRTGDRLGRRDLAHPHGTRPFTRSSTVEVPNGVDCVVVRGHDQTHGYGGQAMLVSIGSGATEALRQGSESISAADEPCP